MNRFQQCTLKSPIVLLGTRKTDCVIHFFGEKKMKQFCYFVACCLLFAAFVARPATAQTTTFVDCMAQTGINFVHQLDGTCPAPQVGSGSAWADYDNDGDIDFYITNHGGPSGLFRNEGDTNADGMPDFIDVAPTLGV